jgi:hypothetical protein
VLSTRWLAAPLRQLRREADHVLKAVHEARVEIVPRVWAEIPPVPTLDFMPEPACIGQSCHPGSHDSFFLFRSLDAFPHQEPTDGGLRPHAATVDLGEDQRL